MNEFMSRCGTPVAMTSDVDFRKALASAEELQITFVGRKSGKRFSVPVWFAVDGTAVYLLPVGGTGSKWYKSILKNPTMELGASGKTATVNARPVTDRKQIDATMDMFREKYGASDVKKYYPEQDAAVELMV
jgi:deazaflavin-dependent oxidoreductase (nitroreductase family)